MHRFKHQDKDYRVRFIHSNNTSDLATILGVFTIAAPKRSKLRLQFLKKLDAAGHHRGSTRALLEIKEVGEDGVERWQLVADALAVCSWLETPQQESNFSRKTGRNVAMQRLIKQMLTLDPYLVGDFYVALAESRVRARKTPAVHVDVGEGGVAGRSGAAV